MFQKPCTKIYLLKNVYKKSRYKMYKNLVFQKPCTKIYLLKTCTKTRRRTPTFKDLPVLPVLPLIESNNSFFTSNLFSSISIFHIFHGFSRILLLQIEGALESKQIKRPPSDKNKSCTYCISSGENQLRLHKCQHCQK